MIKNILNLDSVTILKKGEQKAINAGFFANCPQFQPCWRDSDCACGGCGVTVNNNGEDLYIPDLCAF
ncbi:hypothetical protein D1816_03390 [Aquimarina sp. AD10]|uniref:Uncharacterized protein n=1 Tax=Aquimarina aggregata TaxID=1642818 RepID=A0A163CMH6_9FLAO|nr:MULTISPECIES: hypothetical protein [Aquimarina]AXT59432.1 hypothetical protein D1816_03390 [Aquimarina sp. AD10]KZS42570.1 hypothetical protein AWE51_03760 [Aquimarina aggregata]RKN00334.1 hypothetical protein D7033_08220 [Aquimarina sp. AD10]